MSAGEPSWAGAVVDELLMLPADATIAAVGPIDPGFARLWRERGGRVLAAPSSERVALLVCAADLSLTEGGARWEAAAAQADRILLLVTPEDERALERARLPLVDEWVRWFASRGFGRDFESTFAPQPGALFLTRHHNAFGALVGRYERRLEQLEREVVVLRRVASEYGHEVFVREQAIDRLLAQPVAAESVVEPEDDAPGLDELMRGFALVRRRFAPATSARIKAFDWAVARLATAERLLLDGFDVRDQLLARGRQLSTRLRRGER